MKRFKKKDKVIVISGSCRGQTGVIISIKEDFALVKGINIRTIHKKPTSQKKGEIVKVEKPIHISNISHLEDGKAIKVKFLSKESAEDNKFSDKIRVSKKTGNKI
ncbi:50S ribosomal protein L24 [Flavobacteriaceae bacterium]|nr:50S ribosomal protein L24 [Flavobacteriaceae bacterium]